MNRRAQHEKIKEYLGFFLKSCEMIKDFLIQDRKPENMIDRHDKNLKFPYKKYKLKREMTD